MPPARKLVPSPAVARIESIRPGGDWVGRFAEYALPELLIGILRGNLSGRLDVELGPRRNQLFFRDGVPVCVSLPDVQVSLAEILVAFGELDPATGERVRARAVKSGHSESRVITAAELCSEGALHAGMRARARAEVVRLFDAGDRAFRFVEGEKMPADGELTILQPLPLIYHGLSAASDRSPVQAFLARATGARFRLTATYPRGVDPFEWGEAVERGVGQLEHPQSLDELVQGGLPADQAAVALTTLELAGMLERVADAGGAPVAVDDDAPLKLRPMPRVVRPVSALHAESLLPPVRASSGVAPRPARPTSRVPLDHDGERAAVLAKLSPLVGKSYYDLLRVRPSSTLDQIERAAKFLGGDVDAAPDPGERAFFGLIAEAGALLRDPQLGPRYAQALERAELDPRARRELHLLEVEPKVERAVRRMGEGRTGEAEILLEWASRLDPSRSDLRIHREFLAFCRAEPARRAELARNLRPVIAAEALRNPEDPRLQLYFAAVVAELGDVSMARGALGHVDPEHPLARAVARRIGI